MSKLLLSLFLFSNVFLVYSQATKKGLESISQHNAGAIIGFLASDAMRGREAGSPEGKIAAEYLVSKLKELGIQPLGHNYFQDFEALQPVGKKAARWQSRPDSIQTIQSKGLYRKLHLKNILSMIPGRKTDEYVVVGAHYDHLGADEDMPGDGIYNGADDNASGVSAVLQIARAFVLDGKQPERNIIFAFWDGEEKGLLGSQYFISAYPDVKKIKSYLNFDMVGRNNNEAKPRHVVFFYTAGHPSFEAWLRSDIKTFQLDIEPDYRAWENPVGGSANGSFAQAGIPILWYHTDGHKDYHQPSDTPEKINWKKLTEITKAAYLNTWKMANQPSH